MFTGIPFQTFSNPSLNRAAGTVGGWKELARTTLGSANSTIDVSSLPNKRYYHILFDSMGRSGTATTGKIQGGNSTVDTGNNYARRQSLNGGADGTSASTDGIVRSSVFDALPHFQHTYLANLSAQEKLAQSWIVSQRTASAANAPAREESVGKHAFTSNPWDIIRHNTGGSDTYDSGSEVVVLGWDPADVHTTNFWEELASVDQTSEVSSFSTGTFTAKKYLWVQIQSETSNASIVKIQFNNDTANNYARRLSLDGAADTTTLSTDGIFITGSGQADAPVFVNMFIINNSANEKLVTMHAINQKTAGAANAPERTETVGKWANTSSQITEIDVFPTSGTLTGKMRVFGSN